MLRTLLLDEKSVKEFGGQVLKICNALWLNRNIALESLTFSLWCVTHFKTDDLFPGSTEDQVKEGTVI